MNICKKIGSIALMLTISTAALMGCTSADKTSAQETVTAFLDIVKSGTNENIEQYATEEVTSGEFVKTFDSEYLIEQLKNSFETAEIDSETNDKLNVFYDRISGMVSSYEITKVSIEKKNTATAIVKINTEFPVNIFGSEETSNRVKEAAEKYHQEHDKEISKLYEDVGEEEAQAQLYPVRVKIALDTYSQIIDESKPETYAIVLSLEKNTETDSWYVTGIDSFDSSVNGKTETATDTAVSVDATDTDASVDATDTAVSVEGDSEQ